MEYFEEKEGNIFFIPLFLPNDIKNNIKSYSRINFTPTLNYGFGRLIQINKSGGDLVEIFNYTGTIPNTSDCIINSGLLFAPLHVTMGFSKKRWRFIFEDLNYNRERDSNYSTITFLLGDKDNPKLWKGGKQKVIDSYDIVKYCEWITYPPTEVEDMIRNHIFVK